MPASFLMAERAHMLFYFQKIKQDLCIVPSSAADIIGAILHQLFYLNLTTSCQVEIELIMVAQVEGSYSKS